MVKIDLKFSVHPLQLIIKAIKKTYSHTIVNNRWWEDKLWFLEGICKQGTLVESGYFHLDL